MIPKIKESQPIEIINNSRVLHKQIESLSLENENYLNQFLKQERIKNIIKIIDERTPIGMEEAIEDKINKLFNGLVMK